MIKKSLTRREALKSSLAAGSLAAIGLPLASCGRNEPDTGTPADGLAPAETGAVSVNDLAKQIRGDLLTPDSPSYDTMRKVWNGMIDRYPLAIARCRDVDDVVACVTFAHGNGIPATVRGGGHNVAGKAVRDDALIIDLSEINAINVDAPAKRAMAGGGARWASFDAATLQHDLYTTGGTVSATGIGGLTLGGGLGWLMRKHGLSCDNLVGAQVVTADGNVLTANASDNPDLYWALRGGGGNFGIVTQFEFALHDVAPLIGGIAMYPRVMLRDLFDFYRDFVVDAPDEIETQCGALIGPPGSPLEGEVAGFVAVCHAGPVEAGEALINRLKEFGPPTMDFIGPTTYGAQQTMFDAGMVVTSRNYWRSSFVTELSDDMLDLMVTRADEMPRPGSLLLVEHMGGAIARVGQNETAFANRGANFNVSILSSWMDPADDERNIAWTRATGDELKSFSEGGAYVNYMADEDAANVRAAYEANFDRLVEVKRQYDPDNFFKANQNIRP